MSKFFDLINRLRHNRGFGIQSPSAFYFVTQVLKEHLPYYAYEEIDTAARREGAKDGKYYRRLFRIANYFKPESIIIVGSGDKALRTALAMARRNAVITATEALPPKTPPNTLIYIGEECKEYDRAIETAIEQAASDTVIIAENIHATPQKTACWARATEHPKTVVTYDLYSDGILLFDKEKQKQNYTLKM